MLRHDQDCPQCGGRGHIWVDPVDLGWVKAPEARAWFAKGGGVHTFTIGEREHVMVLCACVQRDPP